MSDRMHSKRRAGRRNRSGGRVVEELEGRVMLAIINSLIDPLTGPGVNASNWTITDRGLENNGPAGYNAQPPGQVSRFNAFFNPNINPGNPTFVAVLQGNAGTGNAAKDQVAQYVVAALLNVGPPVLTPVLSAAAVKDIWSEFATNGSFSPSAGASWSAAEIIAYLQTTMQ